MTEIAPTDKFVPQPELEVAFLQGSRESPPLEAEEYKVPSGEDLYLEALALYEQGQYEEVAGKLIGWISPHQTTHSTPDLYGKAMALLARVHANQGKLAEALTYCEKAVAVGKLNPGYHYLLAIILQEQGRVEEATTSLKRALYLDQNFVLAQVALGNLAQQQGKFKQSARHFENALWLLQGYQPEEILPESDGLTAGRLMEVIRSMIQKENLYEKRNYNI
ncbi:MAG: tetratricopeptide repeat protein [Nitrospira sp.]|nr:tetratricopeptide repeat protein [Nitrospira sp.]